MAHMAVVFSRSIVLHESPTPCSLQNCHETDEDRSLHAQILITDPHEPRSSIYLL